jgi:hypothetical protein
MKLNPSETELNGNWIIQGGDVVADKVCSRIETLTEKYLQQVGTDQSGWDQLYLDPADGRLWELLYLQSEMQGGGPPTLRVVGLEEAKAKYGYGGQQG